MTDPQTFLLIAGGFVLINAGTHIGVKIITDRLLNNGKNGFCDDHHSIKSTLDTVLAAFEDEKQEDMMTRALTKALKKNGK